MHTSPRFPIEWDHNVFTLQTGSDGAAGDDKPRVGTHAHKLRTRKDLFARIAARSEGVALMPHDRQSGRIASAS